MATESRNQVVHFSDPLTAIFFAYIKTQRVAQHRCWSSHFRIDPLGRWHRIELVAVALQPTLTSTCITPTKKYQKKKQQSSFQAVGGTVRPMFKVTLHTRKNYFNHLPHELSIFCKKLPNYQRIKKQMCVICIQ
jgi:hypothetical protein